jgi:hypothetical protein
LGRRVQYARSQRNFRSYSESCYEITRFNEGSDTSSEYKLYSTGHSIAIAPRRKHGRLPITVCLFSLFVTADLWIYDKEVLTKTTTHRLKCIGYPLLVFLTGLGIFANIGFLQYNLQALLRCRSERRSTTPPQMTIMSHSCLPLKQRTNP